MRLRHAEAGFTKRRIHNMIYEGEDTKGPLRIQDEGCLQDNSNQTPVASAKKMRFLIASLVQAWPAVPL